MLSASCSGTLWWYSNRTRHDGMEYTLTPHNWKEYILHGNSVEHSIQFGEWNNSRRKRELQSSTSSLFHTSESTPKRHQWRETSWWSITLFFRKYIIKHIGNAVKMRYIGQKTERRIKDCNFGKQNQAQSWPTSQCQEVALTEWNLRTEFEFLFERLATARPAPKVTLKSNWPAQQQPQQPTLEEGVNISWKQHATWESKARVGDETKRATEVELTSRKPVRTVSKVDVSTHLSEQEVITDSFSKNEANSQEIERVKIGSNKNCIREDLAKEKMVLSKESSRAVFEMGNV